jgi:hypothetical protein
VHSEMQIRAEFELQFAERNAKDNCAKELFRNERLACQPMGDDLSRFLLAAADTV